MNSGVLPSPFVFSNTQRVQPCPKCGCPVVADQPSMDAHLERIHKPKARIFSGNVTPSPAIPASTPTGAFLPDGTPDSHPKAHCLAPQTRTPVA